MIVIRKAVMDKFTQTAQERYVNKMTAYLRKRYPQTYDSLGDANVRERTHHGIGAAQSYGFLMGDGISQYVELTFFWGKKFDQQQAWAQDVLRGLDVHGPRVTIERMHQEGMGRIDHND